MTSKEDILQGEKMVKTLNSPILSEGEDGYEDSSHGSEFQPPDLEPGVVHVDADCCRARYRRSRADPNNPISFA